MAIFTFMHSYTQYMYNMHVYDAYWWCYGTDMFYILHIVFKFYFILG